MLGSPYYMFPDSDRYSGGVAADMTKRRVIIGVLVLMGLGVLVWVTVGRAKEPRVAVGFVGYTNDVAGNRVARVAVSNLNGFVVRRRAHYWREELTATAEANRVGGWFSSANDLEGGAVEVVEVATPTNAMNGLRWRVAISVTADVGMLFEAIDGVELMLFGPFGKQLRDRKAYEFRSGWIEGGEE